MDNKFLYFFLYYRIYFPKKPELEMIMPGTLLFWRSSLFVIDELKVVRAKSDRMTTDERAILASVIEEQSVEFRRCERNFSCRRNSAVGLLWILKGNNNNLKGLYAWLHGRFFTRPVYSFFFSLSQLCCIYEIAAAYYALSLSKYKIVCLNSMANHNNSVAVLFARR